MLDKKNEKLGFNLTMRFEWTILREPESTTAQKLVSGVSEIAVLNEGDGGR